jgi:hypothetical protein
MSVHFPRHEQRHRSVSSSSLPPYLCGWNRDAIHRLKTMPVPKPASGGWGGGDKPRENPGVRMRVWVSYGDT